MQQLHNQDEALEQPGSGKKTPGEGEGAGIEAQMVEEYLLKNGAIVIFRCQAVEGWPIEYVSPNITAQYGYQPDGLTGGKMSYQSLIHRDDLERVMAEVKALAGSAAMMCEQEYRLLHASQEYRWVNVHWQRSAARRGRSPITSPTLSTFPAERRRRKICGGLKSCIAP